jgi:glucose uptake protein GlcU
MHRFKNYGPYEFVKWLGNCIQNLAILVTLGLICVYCYNEVKFDVNNIIHIILFLLILLFNIGFASWLKNIKIETEDQQKFKTNLTILYILSMFICFGIALNLNHFFES